MRRGSFAQAAGKLGISQTSVHRSARSLEAQLQAELFRNTAVGITTNERGAKLAERLLHATREVERGLDELNAGRGVVRGRILVGALNLAGSYFLASTLSEFLSVHKSASVTVINGLGDALIGKHRAGSLDFVVGLLRKAPSVTGVIEEELMRDPYVVAVRNRHPLANRKKISRADLVGFDWILAPSPGLRRIAFENTFPGLHGPHSIVETYSLPTITSILANSDRIAILTESELAVAHRQGQRLKALNFGPIEPSTAIGVTIREDWHPTYLQHKFLEFLREHSSKCPRFNHQTEANSLA
jgi:LysR family transcriptional regulator, regulator for genes of the gallate degradation pathway